MMWMLNRCCTALLRQWWQGGESLHMLVRTASSPKYLQSKASWLHGCGMYRHRGPMDPCYKTLVNFKIPYEQMGMEINWEKRGGNQSVTAKEKLVFAMDSEWRVGMSCDCCLPENLACPRKAQKRGKRGWGTAQWTECSACRFESRSLDSFSIHCKPATQRGS